MKWRSATGASAMTGSVTTLAKLNTHNREFWDQRRANINALLAKPHLVAIVEKREAEKARFVHLAMTEAVRIERIRNQKPFESELENAAEEFGSLQVIEAQRRRARRPRGKVTDDGKTLNQVIEILVSNPEYLYLSAPELWAHLFAELDLLLLDPREIPHQKSSKKSA
jgi:hypothetical protein